MKRMALAVLISGTFGCHAAESLQILLYRVQVPACEVLIQDLRKLGFAADDPKVGALCSLAQQEDEAYEIAERLLQIVQTILPYLSESTIERIQNSEEGLLGLFFSRFSPKQRQDLHYWYHFRFRNNGQLTLRSARDLARTQMPRSSE